MKRIFFCRALQVALAALVCLLSACDSSRFLIDALRRDIAAYPSDPTEKAAAAIDANFARLDARIAELQSAGRHADASAMIQQRDALRAQYTGARVGASLLKAKQAAEGLGEAFRQAGESLGEAMKGDNAADPKSGKDTP